MRVSFHALALLLVVAMAGPVAAQDEVVSSAPKISAFSLTPDNIKSISNSVNLYSGDLNLPLNIVSRPTKNNIGVDVTLSYTSNAHWDSDVRNMEAPTGALGLGWSLPDSKIVADNKSTGVRTDDEYYLLDNGMSSKLLCVGMTATERTFEAKMFVNWKIKYTESSERWEVIKDDGTKVVYGDKNSGRNTVNWIVKWGNYIGPSSLVTGQQRQGNAWYVSEVTNDWGDKVTYGYEATERAVGTGGLTHTEESHLKTIADTWGNSVEFVYASKTINEYADPHTEKLEPDAYQESFERRYLDKILVKSGATVFEELRFSYSLMGTGETMKRLLMSVSKYNPIGEVFRIMSFEYNLSGNVKGAMSKVITALGGEVTYDYGSGTLPRTSRKRTINSPSTLSYAEPRAFFGDNYAVVTWRELDAGNHATGSTGKNLRVEVYTWAGRWIKEPDLFLIGSVRMNSSQKQDVKIETGRDFFAVLKPNYSGNLYTLRLYHKDDTKVGGWTELSKTIDLGSHDEDREGLFAGDNFIAVTSNNGKLFGYTWTGTTWREDIFQEPTRGHATAFGHNYILSHDSAPDTDLFTMYVLNEQNQWITINQGVTGYNSHDGAAYWHGSNSYAFNYRSGGDDYIFRWNEQYQLITPFHTGSNQPHTSAMYTGNSLLAIAEYDPSAVNYKVRGWRYNGSSWIFSNTSTSLTQPKFADDMFYSGSSSAHSLRVYNPNTNTWGTTSLAHGRVFYLGNNTIYQSDALKMGYRSPSGSWSFEDEFHDYYVDLATDKFVLSHGNAGVGNSQVRFFRNGVIDNSLPSNRTAAQHWIYTPNTQLMSADSYIWKASSVTMNDARTIDLFHIVNFNHQDVLTDYPLVKVTVNNGSVSSSTMYEYDFTRATFDVTGKYAQYNKVTIIPGTTNPSVRPSGYAEYYHYNGLSETELVETFPGTSGGQYALYLGSLYRTKTYNASSQLVSSVENIYSFTGQTLTNGYGSQIAYRRGPKVVQSVLTQDGYQNVVERTYNSRNQLATETTYYGTPGGTTSPKVTMTLTYGHEKYPELLNRNLLTPVIQQNKTIGSETVAGSVTRWKEWTSSAGTAYAAADSYTLTAPSIYDGDFSEWDAALPVTNSFWKFAGKVTMRGTVTGNALETMSTLVGIDGTRIYNETQQQIIAEVSNAASTDVAYNSFEDNAFGNFAVREGAVITGSAKTGLKYFNPGTAQGLTKSGLTAEKTYIVSFWAKASNGTLLVDGISGNIIINNADWKYYEFRITGKTSTYIRCLGATPVDLDEIRIYPASAVMTTYTHHPFFGLLSRTDINNRTVYNVYDSFGKMIATLDDNRDVIQATTYKVK